MAALECSRATLTRTIATMRDHLNAPIEYDAERNGYVYVAEGIPANWELPGLWFSATELQALLTFERLFSSLSPGLLAEELRPFRERIETLMQNHQIGTGELHERLHILGMGVRGLNPPLFRTVAAALGNRRQLDIDYRSRSRDEHTRRTLSPQRLVYYRDNWYLDAWCHLREGARIFALDRIARAEPREDACHHMDESELDARLKGAYGIFQGVPRATAVLHFSPRMARWVADERWHAEQRGQWLTDGRYELELPYADPTELIRDVLRYGSDVEVVKPAALRKLVRDELQKALDHYADGRAHEPVPAVKT